NADGTGADIPELYIKGTIALYGGIDVYLAAGGVEGGFEVTGTVNLNDPDNDGKIRAKEMIAIIDHTGNPLDLADIEIKGEVYARWYFKIMIPIPYPFGIKRVTVVSAGEDFARARIF